MTPCLKAILVTVALLCASYVEVRFHVLPKTPTTTAATTSEAAAPALSPPPHSSAVGPSRAYCDTNKGFWQPCAQYEADAMPVTS